MSRKFHPYLVIFHTNDSLGDGTSEIDVRIYDNVKSTGAWHSLQMMQQVTADVQPGLTAQVNGAVSLHRTCMVNVTFCHHFFCSWTCMTNYISHTCGRRSCRPARYLPISTHSHISWRCLATAIRVSSSITTGHYVLNKDVDLRRLGSENNAMKEAQQAHT